jgi:hypothetical protein
MGADGILRRGEGERTIYQTANAESCGDGGRAEGVRRTLALPGSRRVGLRWPKVDVTVPYIASNAIVQQARM